MFSLITQIFIVIILLTGNCSDECNQYLSYTQCTSSQLNQCMWDLVRNNCHFTNDYLQGCSAFLNKMACQKQLGDPLGELGRFTTQCEKILDEQSEKCYNNLSKYGCLSVQNPGQICIWKDNMCQQLVKPYASACSLIQHYLIIHSSILWNIISYTPDLQLEAYQQEQRDLNIEITDTSNYDDPNVVQMQNSYLKKNGKFEWYKLGVQNQYIQTNLQISSRTREGCIALEIYNDADFLSIFSLQNEIRGINHIYCKYLNKLSIKTKQFLFQENKCVSIDTNNLMNQDIIEQYKIRCHQLDQNQCVYLNSKEIKCQIKTEEDEYPCVEESIGYETDCIGVLCTINQCQKLDNHYIEQSTNMCVDTCTTITDKLECLEQDCIYLGIKNTQNQIICAPKDVCNQISLTKSNCFQLRAKCDWNDEENRCYELQDFQISYMKCSDAYNVYVCTYISLSDQMCYWSQELMKCINILDQPLLIDHQIFLDRQINENNEIQIMLVCNLNLCKYNQLISTEYDTETRICQFDEQKFNNKLDLINKYYCLQYLQSYNQWDSEKQICQKIEQADIINIYCNDLVNVNERFCQFGQLSSNKYACIYDSNTYSCIEKTMTEVNNLGCSGYGLSRELCLNKNVEGQFCNYSDGLCIEISLNMINNIKCQSLSSINQQVCRMQLNNQVLCEYDEQTHSCVSLDLNNKIEYSYNLNRYACQAVSDKYTYFNEEINRCIEIDINQSIYFSQLRCEDHFVNKLTCLQIITEGQTCIWNYNVNRCKNYPDHFSSCSFFEEGNSKTCSRLTNLNYDQLVKEYFCVYENNKCQSKVESMISCGEDQIMNIHYCSGLTGIDQDGQHIQMCAFVDNKCIFLSDQSMDTEIILNNITCSQANAKTCSQVKTPGQYCFSNYSVEFVVASLDVGCKNYDVGQYCFYFGYYFEDPNLYNLNICSSAQDECVYDSIEGCIRPTSSQMFDCEHPGVSLKACIRNTNDRRCSFMNQSCQYITEYQVFIDNCNLLNKFACASSPFIQCIWDTKSKLCKPVNLSTIQSISSHYFCSSDGRSIFLLSGISKCIQINEVDYNHYSCDTPGLNKYGCHNLPTQYCQFLNNQCDFYNLVKCEDYVYECSSYNSNDYQCVFQDGKCFTITNTLYDCDSFEKTNYLFCLQYPNCIYKDQQCQQIIEQSQYENCQSIDNITSCTVQNIQHKCQYSNHCDNLDLYLSNCPSLNGYYSRNACTQFQDCTYGYTKSGYGFCFQGQNILQLTCNQLPHDLCLEDLQHLNNDLKCFWNQTCKNIQTENLKTCNDLLQYKSSYAACMHLNNVDCKYSFEDKKCKLVNEYNGISCVGSSKQECDLRQQTCYFNDIICTDSGIDNQINKYGCIHKSGYYLYNQGQCTMLQSTNYQQSCRNLSKDACLSKLTKEIHCRWIDEKCKQVLKQENKEITSCQNLNQRACQEVVHSSIQCQWNSDIESCETIDITNFDCTIADFTINTSISLCSSQINGNCVRNIDRTKCSTITRKISSCTSYGLNKTACITLTSIPCIWKQLNNGGYCDDANLYQSQCTDLLNEQACVNVKNIGQYCKWDTNENVCLYQEITNCQSANNLNGNIPCKAVMMESCQFNQLINQCLKITDIPTDCSDSYNQQACIQSTKGCVWSLNTCKQQEIQNCNLFLNKFVCLNDTSVPCQWVDNKCQSVEMMQPKIYCKNLPSQLNQFACQQNAIDPCNLNLKLEICVPSQTQLNNSSDFMTISQLLMIQQMDYPQPILQYQCENLQSKSDCINSRLQNQACIWINSCQNVLNFYNLKCSDSINIWACLSITNSNQFCLWNQKCLNWSKENPIMTNINVNVCIYHSYSSIYSNYSCQKKDIDKIDCHSFGISKQTCLSIPNKACQWQISLNMCQEYEQDLQKRKCSEYQLVSPYVCQILLDNACIHDQNTFSCIETPKNSQLIGISKQACLLNDEKPIFWNEFNQCQDLTKSINCNSQLQVNFIACQSISDQPCLYNQKLNQCVSQFNIWSLKCDTIGLNLKGCSQVQSEPCIFKNNKCQKFVDYTSQCIMIKNVNALACASIMNQNCIYDSITLKCEIPIYQSDICNISGKNKSYCEQNSICQWSSENLECKCVELQSEMCKFENSNDCKDNQLCYYNGNKCIRKQCHHLEAEDCISILDDKTCYLNNLNDCQSATKCEDIIDSILPCSQYSFNSIQCVKIGNQCYSQNNLQIYCPYSDCSNPKCIYQLGICKAKTCSDYNVKDCNSQGDCYLGADNTCQILTSCSQINDYGEQAMNRCNQVSVQGFRCNWQKMALLDKIEVCTNQPCLLYGSSTNLCHGNEINGYSCILSSSLICQQCEQITEKCQCEKYKQICIYENRKCFSISCSSFLTKKKCIETQNRCYWSTQINQDNNSIIQKCVKECIKIINEDECNSRTKECYYDQLQMKCIKGQKKVIDLSADIVVEEFYSNIIKSMIVINILFL